MKKPEIILKLSPEEAEALLKRVKERSQTESDCEIIKGLIHTLPAFINSQ